MCRTTLGSDVDDAKKSCRMRTAGTMFFLCVATGRHVMSQMALWMRRIVAAGYVSRYLSAYFATFFGDAAIHVHSMMRTDCRFAVPMLSEKGFEMELLVLMAVKPSGALRVADMVAMDFCARS